MEQMKIRIKYFAIHYKTYELQKGKQGRNKLKERAQIRGHKIGAYMCANTT